MQLDLLEWAATNPPELKLPVSAVKYGDIITINPWKGPKTPRSGVPLFEETDQLEVVGIRSRTVAVSYADGDAFASVWIGAILTINGAEAFYEPLPPKPKPEPKAPKIEAKEMGEVAVENGQAFYSASADGRWTPWGGEKPSKGHLVKAQASPWAFEFLKFDGEDAIAQFVGYPQYLRRIPLAKLLVKS